MNLPERVTRALIRDVTLPEIGTIALITLTNQQDAPTTLGPTGLQNLGEAFDQVENRDRELAGVAITGKPHVFCVGADLKHAGSVTEPRQARDVAELGHRQFQRLANLPVPSAAFINGPAIGGGLELALHADYRTGASTVRALSLPEVSLGLIPGWGGAWLLPQLVGPAAALQIMLHNPLRNNRQLSSAEALELGLIDAQFDPADFLECSLAWFGAVITGKVTPHRRQMSRATEPWAAAVAAGAQFAEQRTGGQSPAAQKILELVSQARTAPREAGFQAEEDALTELMFTPEFAASMYSFGLVQAAKKPSPTPLAQPITKVGIVGAGLMARQIALLVARKVKVPVVLTDQNSERLTEGLKWIGEEVARLQATNRLSAFAGRRITAEVTAGSLQDFADCDLVLEAVNEELGLKQKVFADLALVVSAHCLLASNTSSLSLSAMASVIPHPGRFLGLHFFNPVAIMPLVELGRTAASSDTALDSARQLIHSLGKITIEVADSPSFVVNRLLGRMSSETGRLADQGIPLLAIDQALSGLAPMPPFVLTGLVGPAIALHNCASLAAAFPTRFAVPSNLKELVAAGLPGYYLPGKPGKLDPRFLAVAPRVPVTELSAADIRTAVLRGLAEEVTQILDEGTVSSAAEIDLALLTGAGFSWWNGGITALLTRRGLLPPGRDSRSNPEIPG